MRYEISLNIGGEDIECAVHIQPDRMADRGWDVAYAERETDDGPVELDEADPLFARLMEEVDERARDIEIAWSDWLDPAEYRAWQRHVS